MMELFNSQTASGSVLSGQKRINAIKKELKIFSKWKMETEVECMCCNKSYKVKEATAFVPLNRTEKEAMVLCKNYPDCPGTILDFWNDRVMAPYMVKLEGDYQLGKKLQLPSSERIKTNKSALYCCL